jgi:hypothetical protein
MLKIKFRQYLGRAVDSLVHEISVVVMNSLEYQFQRGLNRSIILKDLVTFFRPEISPLRTLQPTAILSMLRKAPKEFDHGSCTRFKLS